MALKRVCILFALLVLSLNWTLSCGKAKSIFKGTFLGPAEIGDDGSRSDGNNLGNLYEVVQIITGTDGDFPSYGPTEYPFVGARIPFNTVVNDRQVPFTFSFTYPPNNYKLNEAHLVLDTSRDGSDTEGIMVDGVFTGRIVQGVLNTTLPNPKVLYRNYLCGDCAGGLVGVAPISAYYMTWSLSHYKAGVINTFDLNMDNLLPDPAVSAVSVVNDGLVEVVTGDDSPIFDGAAYGPKLFMKGVTISKTPLSCVTSPTFQFRNVYIHNDGNSISIAAFSGTVDTPYTSALTVAGGFRSVEFYFDPSLPSVAATTDIDLTAASIAITIQRNALEKSAIVINGVGISEAGFDRNQATAVVESWNDTAATNMAFNTWLSSIPTNSTYTGVTLNLISLFGAAATRDLIAQGKLNVAVAGGLDTVAATNHTAIRTYATPVAGPELTLNGTYHTEICQVPNDPASPLSDDNPNPPGTGDDTSPVVSSVQVINITSNSATIQWLTDEGSDSLVNYGVGATNLSTPLDATMKTYHTVNLTGLQAYKYYYYEVVSKDGNGNATVYATKVFRTLR